MKNIVVQGIILISIIMFSNCNQNDKQGHSKNAGKQGFITSEIINETVKKIETKENKTNIDRIKKGVSQAAAFWTENDGTQVEFENFCIENFVLNEKDLQALFESLSINYEVLYGNFNKITLDLRRKLDLNDGEVKPIDMLFGGYDASAHLTSDFFNNKIAYVVLLNFPFYTIEEKNKLSENWSRLDWAYAKMGSIYVSRIPSELLLKSTEILTAADAYISEYNIMMGNLVDNNKKTYFDKELKLISHWGLRDELKTHYGKADGLVKQQMIYEVMKRIIKQEIPENITNNKELTWNPYTNKVYKEDKEVAFKSEPNTRYGHLLKNFNAEKDFDAYCPSYPTAIKRKFDADMQMTQAEVEKLFIDFLSSPQVKKVAALISKRLNRKLEPFDIWYDGFKARSSISESDLNAAVNKKYPNKDAFEKDLPNILVKLGFKPEKAAFITSKISVDASRGAGHAWESSMKSEKAHLRTRIGKNGMDYKGYNIAIHEFGHNVEQTISLQNVDYYMLRGVPNTAFTEALAFIFQKRDLELLGIKDENVNKKYLLTLDNFWSCYEIMGVSIVDMRVWKWLYEHPDASAAELKETVIRISNEVWNSYYAEVFGIRDQPILAIYSHMIDAPLYLSAYPVGQLIEFQIEKQIEGKNFADEVERMYKTGNILPQKWMKNAVGSELSNQPILEATEEALLKIQ